MKELEQKEYIDRAIARAREGVGDRIDELDQRLRTSFNPKQLAQTYGPHMIAGGAILGVIVGFGLPKVLRRVVVWGVPLSILAVTIKNARERNGDRYIA